MAEQTIETLVIWDTIALILTSRYNDYEYFQELICTNSQYQFKENKTQVLISELFYTFMFLSYK